MNRVNAHYNLFNILKWFLSAFKVVEFHEQCEITVEICVMEVLSVHLALKCSPPEPLSHKCASVHHRQNIGNLMFGFGLIWPQHDHVREVCMIVHKAKHTHTRMWMWNATSHCRASESYTCRNIIIHRAGSWYMSQPTLQRTAWQEYTHTHLVNTKRANRLHTRSIKVYFVFLSAIRGFMQGSH